MVFSLGVFGGTFDPVHLGHIKLAQKLLDYFNFDELHLLPCKAPVLKKTAQASTIQRLSMLKLATKDLTKLIIDTRELERTSPSYMVETLKDLRKQYGKEASISLILGSDAFRQLPEWYQFHEIKNLANCIVLYRQEDNKHTLSDELLEFTQNALTSDKNRLLRQSHGLIMNFNAGNYLISSTEVRKKIACGEDLGQMLDPTVIDYIKDQKLYV